MEMDRTEDADILGSVADKIGVPTDMVIFLGGEAFCLLCAVLYYKYLPPSNVNVAVRHVVAVVIGIFVGYFSFGMQFSHMLVQSAVCFVAMQVLPQRFMHIAVFCLAMLYLIVLHLYRAYMIPEDVIYSIDVSGPLMIVTEKITSLAFSIYDGRHGNKDKLSDLQKRYMISKPPSALEYFSYLFYFQGVVVGPLSFYKDYIAYVDGTDKNIENNGKQSNNNMCAANQKLSPFYSVVYKLLTAIFWMGFHLALKPLYPEILNSDLDFIRQHSFLYRFWYMLFSMLCSRAKYYIAFSLGDAICNASGFGFNGYDKKGQPRWDLITNVNIFGIEGATSPKLYLDNWNIQTAVWLRLVCYDRVPVQRQFVTFLLSAMWHGCYPGYYFAFAYGAVLVATARKARRKIRPHFQKSRIFQILYDILTWMGTHIMISYIFIPFTILHLRPTLIFYTYFGLIALTTSFLIKIHRHEGERRSNVDLSVSPEGITIVDLAGNMYWCLHVLTALVFYFLPYIPTSKSDDRKMEQTNASVRRAVGGGCLEGGDGSVCSEVINSSGIKQD